MAKGHRTQIKKERNQEQREKRPYAVLKYARMSSQKAEYVLAAIRGNRGTGYS